MNKYSVHKNLLFFAKLVEDKKASKGGWFEDAFESNKIGYFKNRNCRGKRWAWEKNQLKNANRKIRHSNIEIEN